MYLKEEKIPFHFSQSIKKIKKRENNLGKKEN